MRMKNLVNFLLLCLFAAGVGWGEGFAATAGPEPDSGFRLIGKWTIQQKNASGNTYRGAWVITQRGSEIAGTAEWENHTQGRIEGTLKGNALDLTIFYPNDLKGFYKGSVTQNCAQIVRGTTTANQGNDPGTWTADRHSTLTGKWTIQQQNSSGNTYRGAWVITQSGSEISGAAEWENHMRGRIQGTLVGNNLYLTINYTDDLKGFYKGTLAPGCSQTVKGTTTASRGKDPGTWRAEVAE